jgi:hypothetical protein
MRENKSQQTRIGKCQMTELRLNEFTTKQIMGVGLNGHRDIVRSGFKGFFLKFDF